MPRAKTILQSEFPYNLGIRCINREWFDIPMDDVWKIFSEKLCKIHDKYNVRIHAFLLMSNHYHLIMSTPDSNLSDAMRCLNGESSKRISRSAGRINQVYGGRHFRSVLCSHLYYLHAYKYLYANPVKARIVKRVEDYPYSSLPGLLGKQPLLFPVVEDLTLLSDVQGTLDWLNRPVKEKDWEAVRAALKKSEFSLAKIAGEDHELETGEL